jgi:hypothetical protein
MPNYLLGINAKAYVAAAVLTAANAGAVTGATWAEITNVKDVDLDLSKNEADISARDGNGWESTVGTQKKGTVTFLMRWKPGDDNFEAIRDAWLTTDPEDSEIGLMFLDQDKATTGAQGLAGNFNVIGFKKSEKLNEAQTVEVTVKPSSFTQWYVKAA